MGGFANIIQGILLDRFLRVEPPLLSKVKIGLGLIALSGFFILAGLGFLTFAAFLWLKTFFSLEIVYALTGLLLMAYGAGCCGIAYAMAMYHKKIFKKLKDDISDTVESLFELLDEELKEPISENPKAAILLASLGGYAAGRKIL